MKTRSKIEMHLQMIENIRYDNPNGGVYAYVQFMAYARELVSLLRPLSRFERQIEKVEAVSWLFNEYLGHSFTPRQKVIFETQLLELKAVFGVIRLSLQQVKGFDWSERHAVAA